MDMASPRIGGNVTEDGRDSDSGEEMWESFDELKHLETTKEPLLVSSPSLELEKSQTAGIMGESEREPSAGQNSMGREEKQLTPRPSRERSIFSPRPHNLNADGAVLSLNMRFGGLSLAQTEETIKFECELLQRSPGKNEFQSDRELSVPVNENSPRTCLKEGPVSKKEVLTPPVGSENIKEIRYSPQTRVISTESGMSKSAFCRKSNETQFSPNTSFTETGSKLESSHDMQETTGNGLRTTNLTTGSVSPVKGRHKHPSVSMDQYQALDDLAKDPVRRILPARIRNKRKLYNNQNEVRITSGDSSEAIDLNILHFEEDPLGIFIKEHISSGDNETTDSDFSSPRVRRKRIPFGRLSSEPRKKSSNGIQRKEVLRKSIAQHTEVLESIKSSPKTPNTPNADTELSHNLKYQISPDLKPQSVLQTNPVLRSVFPGNSVQASSRENSCAEGNTVSEIGKPANEEVFLSETNNELGLVRISGTLTLLRGIPRCDLSHGMNQLRSLSCELDADSEQSPDKPVLLKEELFPYQLSKEEMIKPGRSRLSTGVPRYKLSCKLRPSIIPSNELGTDPETSPEKPVSEELFLTELDNGPQKEEIMKSGRSSLSTSVCEHKSTRRLRSSRTSSNELGADTETSPAKLVLKQRNNDAKKVKSGRSRMSAGVPRYELTCRLRPSRTPSCEEDADSKSSPDAPVSKKCLLKQQNNDAQKEEIIKSGRSSLSSVVPPRKCAYKIRPSRKPH